MPYLNLDLDYFSHPKTNRLIGLLGRGSEAFPLRLWCYCGKYHTGDGRLSDYSVQEIESVLGWCGESGKLVQALLKVGFLHKDTTGYYVHDWLEHEGHLGALKEKAKNAAKARWDKYKQVKAPQQVNNVAEETAYAPSNAQAMHEHCSNNAPYHTKPNQPNKTKEKYKKEKLCFSLPDWVPKQPWDDFLEMRKKIRKPLTSAAMQLAVNKLEKLKQEGYDLKEVINQSVLNSWQGFFPLKRGNEYQTQTQYPLKVVL